MTKDDYQRDAEHENEDENDHLEGAGFSKASEQVLANRRLVKAKRPSTKVETSKNVALERTSAATSTSNPFASVNLVASEPPAADLTTTAEQKEEDSGDAEKITAAARPNDTATATVTTSTEPHESSFTSATTSSASKKARIDDHDDKEVEKDDTTTTSTPFVFGASTGFRGFATAASNGSSSTGFGAAAAAGTGGFAFFGGGNSSSTTFSSGFGSLGGENKNNHRFALISSTRNSSSSHDESSSTAAVAASSSSEGKTTTTTSTPHQPVAQLPVQYELKSGEEDEIVILELRCKTYRRGPSSNSSTDTSQAILDNTKIVGKNPSVPHSESSLLTTTTSSKPSGDQDADTNVEQSPSQTTTTTTTPTVTSSTDNALSTSTMEWHEVGIGPLKILRHNQKRSNHRMVQRRESTPGGSATIVILNARLREFVVTAPSEKHVQIVVVMQDPQPVTTYLFKCKLATDAATLKSCLENIQQQQQQQQESQLERNHNQDEISRISVDGHPKQQNDLNEKHLDGQETNTDEKPTQDATEQVFIAESSET